MSLYNGKIYSLYFDGKYLKSEPGNFEIDSVVGKSTDKAVLLTLMDIHDSDLYIQKYNCKSLSFAQSFKKSKHK